MKKSRNILNLELTTQILKKKQNILNKSHILSLLTPEMRPENSEIVSFLFKSIVPRLRLCPDFSGAASRELGDAKSRISGSLIFIALGG